jgi:hypothetical protein
MMKMNTLDHTTRIFQRFSDGEGGWYYEYKNKVSGPYQTEKEANGNLIIRLLDAKPQRGSSYPNTAKP